MRDFTPPDFDKAHAEWGANCGPCALAAVLGKPVMEVRPLFPHFPEKPWTAPRHMRAAIEAAGMRWADPVKEHHTNMPLVGVSLIQWEGSWMNPEVPVAAQYKRTHWIGMDGAMVYDVNADGGWILWEDWKKFLAPRLMSHTTGCTGWHLKLGYEVMPRVPDRWDTSQCDCGGCNVCAMTHRHPMPTPRPPALDKPEQNCAPLDPPRQVKRRPKKSPTPTLFDGAE